MLLYWCAVIGLVIGIVRVRALVALCGCVDCVICWFVGEFVVVVSRVVLFCGCCL